MIASELISDVKIIMGGCDDTEALSILSDAMEVLSNKGNFDFLQRRIILPVTGGYVTLPAEVETPLAATINGVPAFARNRLYEFDLNGPGAGIDRPVAFSFADDMESPLFVQPTAPFQLRYSGDVGGSLRVSGQLHDADPLLNTNRDYLVTTSVTGPLFSRINSVSKGVGAVSSGATADLHATPQGSTEILVARYAWNETSPLYRRLKVDSRATTIRLLYRARTYRLTSVNDFIPLNSRLAVLEMVRARKYYAINQTGLGDFYQGKALEYLSDEQASRNSMEAVAGQRQAAAAIGLNIHAANLVTAADIYDAFADMYPGAGRERVFDRMTDAIEALANKGNFSPLLVYVVLGVQSDYYVSLPPDVEDVIRATIEDLPAFARTRLYEFSVNGPGSAAGKRASVGYENMGEVPTFVQPTGNFRLRLGSDSAALRVSGMAADGSRVDDQLITEDDNDCPLMQRIDAVVRDPADTSDSPATLYAEPGAVLLSTIAPNENAPRYRRLRLSKKALGARLLCRRRTAKIRGFGDVIPLHSRLAVTTMGRALKALAGGDPTLGSELETAALRYLTDEQASRDSHETVAAATQEDMAIGLPIHARDVLTAGDVYDDAAAILGPIGRQKIFDAITDAVESLQNKSIGGWDSQQGLVDINSCSPTGDAIYTLPREVDEIIAVRTASRGLELRNKWMQFHLSGCSSGCTPCGMYEKLPDTFATLTDIATPVRLVALLAAGNEEVEPLRIYGTNSAGAELYDTDGKPGVTLPVHGAGFVPTTLADSDKEMTMATVATISRVLKTETANFVELLAIHPTTKAILYTLGLYYPDRAEERYRRIRVPGAETADAYGACAACIRVAFRRRQEKVQSFSDVLWLRSRDAVVEMIRARAMRATDLQAALAHEEVATRALVEEQAARNPAESFTIQVAPEESLQGYDGSIF